MEQRKACDRCRSLKQGCLVRDGVSCVKCHKAGEECSLIMSTMFLTNGKRKSEDIGDSLERFVRSKRATSSGTVSHINLESPNASYKMDAVEPLRKLQNEQSKYLKSKSKSKSKLELESESWKCNICEKDDRKPMIQCHNKMCNSWCHNKCVRSCKNPRHRLFAPATYLNDWKFICPSCVDQPDGYFSREIAEYLLAIEKLNRRIDSQIHSCLRTEDHRVEFQEYADIEWTDERIPDFELTKEEKFQGLVKAEVDGLMNGIDQSIYNYNKEVVDTIERFSDRNDDYLGNPLADWKLVDTSEYAVTGQPWYKVPWRHIEGPAMNQSGSYHPVTHALRSMLRTVDGEPMEIDRSLTNLTFSQVHTGFVGWFVIDVIANELNIYDFPNMIPMRAMMAAVKDFAEPRWPRKGDRILREVQLRTWYKAPFRNAVLQDEGYVTRRMEAFLDPLTNRFEKIGRWSHHRADIIEHTITLWAYLQSVRGQFVPINPEIGSLFDSQEHEAHDQNGTQLIPIVGTKILWVLRRGFKIIEDGTDGPRKTLVKAHVFLK